jgi:hypothetical protein
MENYREEVRIVLVKICPNLFYWQEYSEKIGNKICYNNEKINIIFSQKIKIRENIS